MWYCGKINEIHENKAFHVDVDNLKTTIDLRLSDLTDSCKLIRLETTPECVLGSYLRYIYVDNKYIIIDDQNGVYKFSSDGLFIKKILKPGRGPQEISRYIRCFYFEKKKILYFDETVRKNNFLYAYDIESEKFLEPVQKCFNENWGDFAIYKDSLIIASLSPGIWGSTDNIKMADSIPYVVFIQNLNGKFLYGIPSNKKFSEFQDEFIQRGMIMTGDKNIHVKYIFDDTLFTLNNNRLSPYIIPNYIKPKENPEKAIPEIGDSRIMYPSYENSSFTIFSESTNDSRTNWEMGVRYNYKYKYFFLNKSNGKYAKISSYIDDLTGEEKKADGNEIKLPELLPNNKLLVVYPSYELLRKKSESHNTKGLSSSIYDQLENIQKDLYETDNPVLLVGIPKVDLQILKRN